MSQPTLEPLNETWEEKCKRLALEVKALVGESNPFTVKGAKAGVALRDKKYELSVHLARVTDGEENRPWK